MVHQLTKFHVQRVDMVINPPWNLPFLGAKGLTSPEQTATVEMVFSQPWTCTFLVAKGLTTPELMANCMIEEIDLDAGITLVPPHVEIHGRYEQKLDTQEGFGASPKVTTADVELNTASTFVIIASPQRHVDTTADDLTLAETLMEIRKSAAKAKGKAKIDETESPRKIKQREQVQISRDAEVAQKLQEEVAVDEDFVQQLQAGEKRSEEDLPMKLVELVNQRKKFFAQQRAEAKRNKPMTPA
ncbi:hypothetical protein Tco_1173339 [Tanacetum coccineum]